MMTFLRRIIWMNCLAAVVVQAALSGLVAQDVVIIERLNGETSRRTGTIESWLGYTLVLKSGNRTRKIDSGRVKQVISTWSEAHQDGKDRMAAGEFSDAIPLLRSAYRTESRDWVRQIILSELIIAYDAVEQHLDSIQCFLRLTKLDPDTRFFYLIPLDWNAGFANTGLPVATERWLKSDDDIERLIAASWNLSAGNRSLSVQILESLTTNSKTEIAQLATTQLWRIRLPTATANDVDRWRRQIQTLQSRLRAGPLVLLAEAESQNGDQKWAQIDYLKIPILYPEKKSLAAFALFQCASILDNENAAGDHSKTTIANRLYGELVRDFPHSRYAKVARGKL